MQVGAGVVHPHLVFLRPPIVMHFHPSTGHPSNACHPDKGGVVEVDGLEPLARPELCLVPDVINGISHIDNSLGIEKFKA